MSNFEKLKTTFQQETGQAWNNNLSVYIAYFQAKVIEDYVRAYFTVINSTKRGG